MSNEKSGKAARPFGIADKIGYMFGDFGNDFTFILSSLFLMKFYTDIMGVEGWVVGVVMMVARVVDAFTDVTMGRICDASKMTPVGKFKPWIRRMCGPVAIASFLIYQSGLAGGLLSLVGYTAATAYDPDVLEGIFNISTIVPAVGFLLLGLVLLFWYPLDKKTVEANVIALKKKHGEL